MKKGDVSMNIEALLTIVRKQLTQFDINGIIIPLYVKVYTLSPYYLKRDLYRFSLLTIYEL